MMSYAECNAMEHLIYQNDSCMIFHCKRSIVADIKDTVKNNFELVLVAETTIDENNIYLIFYLET